MLRLESLFARDGFSDAYIKGEKGAFMFGAPNPAPDREARSAYSDARKLYLGDGEKPLVPVDMYLSARAGEDITLICCDHDGNEVVAHSPAAQIGKKATTKQEIINLLQKN